MLRPRPVKLCPRLAATAVATVIAVLPGLARAQGLAPVEAPRRGEIAWTDSDTETPRTSTPGLFVGVGLMVVGAVQLPIGVSLLSSGGSGCIEFGGRGSFGCDDPNAAKHRAGAALAAIGTTALVSGLALTLWGATRKAQSTDVRVGLGSVAATYRF